MDSQHESADTSHVALRRERAAGGGVQDVWLSVVIPVYNSEGVVGDMIAATLATFDELRRAGESAGEAEIVLVDDASTDGSVEVLRDRAAADDRVIVIELPTNVGQHRALLTGLRRCRGAVAVTLDDDLQNPPDELVHLLRVAAQGHDLVFGRFRDKQHAGYRVAGSRLVTRLNHWLYGLPGDLVVSNVRLLHRDVIDRLLEFEGQRVYLTGWAILCAKRPANAWIEHRARAVGRGNYTWRKLLRLMAAIVLAHPRFPWRALVTLGAMMSVGCGVAAVANQGPARTWWLLGAVAGFALLVATWSGRRGR